MSTDIVFTKENLDENKKEKKEEKLIENRKDEKENVDSLKYKNEENYKEVKLDQNTNFVEAKQNESKEQINQLEKIKDDEHLEETDNKIKKKMQIILIIKE